MIAIAKWVGIILCIICGIGLMAGGPGTIAKVSGLILGLIFALFRFTNHHVGAGAVGPDMTRPAARALNKPLLIVGIDRKLAGVALLLSVIVAANDGGSKMQRSYCLSGCALPAGD